MRAVGATLLLAAAATACGPSSAETTPDGRVDQVALRRRYSTQPKLDLIVALRTSPTADGAALRAAFAEALGAWALTRARGELALRDLWNPIDVPAIVVDAADGSIRSTRDDPSLAWQEADATDAGAARFTAAVDAAVRAAAAGEGTPDRLASSLDRALAIDRHVQRLVVIVTTADASTSVFERSARMRDDDALLVETAGHRFTLETSFADGGPDCWPRPVAVTADGRAACRVRAFVARGADCDATRGWVRPATSAPAALPDRVDSDAWAEIEIVCDLDR